MMEIKTEPDDPISDTDVTQNDENKTQNDEPSENDNVCVKIKTEDTTEANAVVKTEIDTDNHDQKPENDLDNIKTEQDEEEDAKISIGALNTQVKNRKRRKTILNPFNQNSQSPFKWKKSRSRTWVRNKIKKKVEDSLNAVPISNEKSERQIQSVDLPTDSIDDVEYCLTVSNLPVSWSFMEIKNYFDTEVGPVDEIEMIKDDKTGFGAIRLSYPTEKECKDAEQKLQGKVVAGNKLSLVMAAVSPETDTDTNSETTDTSTKPWKPDLDSWEVDLSGMYGLKPQFLKSLGITPPLDKWVHVSNFRCDKSELRDILELAGNVQMCSVFTIANRYANVMYSHPLEAVQAVSMLNNQMFYGQPLKVAMDRSPANTVLLPKGLSGIGSGLGINGKPLRNIVKHYERFIENKECLVNPVAFDVQGDTISDVKFEVKSVDDFNYPIINAAKPVTPSVKSTPTPKPASPLPKVKSPVPVWKPANPVTSSNSQFREVTPYTTFVAPQNNGGIRTQGFQNAMTTSMQQQGQNASFISPSGPIGQRPMGPGPMGPTAMGLGPIGQGSMGTRATGQGPMGQGSMGTMAMGQGPMGQMPMGPRPMGQGSIGPMGLGSIGHGPIGSGPMGQGQIGPGQMGQGPMGPGQMGQGPMGMGPRLIGHGPMGPGPMGQIPAGSGPMVPRQLGPMGPMRPPGPFNNEPVKMKLSNLPPSTTFPLLCDKMSAWGRVVCLQLTTPGCAVVTFGNRMQADACFQHYNGRTIDNHTIKVQYA